MSSQTTAQTPADHRLVVQWWPLAQISPYKHNPRVCPAQAIEGVAASIASFGWKVPLVVSRKGRIIAGHTRYEAALSLGLAELPVIVADDLSKAQQRAYRIADNSMAEATSWDEDLLAGELGGARRPRVRPRLARLRSSTSSPRYSPAAQRRASATPDEAVSNRPHEPITRPGDLWLLGPHRLLCGDATKAADVCRLMDGQRAALMATDPPYLVDYRAAAHPARGQQGRRPARTSTGTPTSTTPTRSSSTRLPAGRPRHALTADAAIYQWFGIMRSEVIWQAWQRGRSAGPPGADLEEDAQRAHLQRTTCGITSPMMYGWPAGASRKPPPADERAVWEIASTIEDGARGIHATQKPVELVPPADRLPHARRRAALRALLRARARP